MFVFRVHNNIVEYFTCCIFFLQLRPIHMKEREELKPSGQSSKYTIRNLDTFMISSTGGKLSVEVNLFVPQLLSLLCQIYTDWIKENSIVLLYLFLLFCRTLRILPEREYCRQKPDCQVEETGLRKSLLLAMHTNKGHKLWDKLYLSSA